MPKPRAQCYDMTDKKKWHYIGLTIEWENIQPVFLKGRWRHQGGVFVLWVRGKKFGWDTLTPGVCGQTLAQLCIAATAISLPPPSPASTLCLASLYTSTTLSFSLVLHFFPHFTLLPLRHWLSAVHGSRKATVKTTDAQTNVNHGVDKHGPISMDLVNLHSMGVGHHSFLHWRIDLFIHPTDTKDYLQWTKWSAASFEMKLQEEMQSPDRISIACMHHFLLSWLCCLSWLAYVAPDLSNRLSLV